MTQPSIYRGSVGSGFLFLGDPQQGGIQNTNHLAQLSGKCIQPSRNLISQKIKREDPVSMNQQRDETGTF
jgi:hypothetical protein